MRVASSASSAISRQIETHERTHSYYVLTHGLRIDPLMSYPILVVLHLFGALIFVGAVFFEVLILEGTRKRVDRDVMREMERAIGYRARRVVPWALLALYGAGLGLAWHYRGVLAHPGASSLGTLLTLKIALAASVLAHFIRAVTWMASGRMTQRRSRIIHLSVFCHLILIVLLAKTMHYGWW